MTCPVLLVSLPLLININVCVSRAVKQLIRPGSHIAVGTCLLSVQHPAVHAVIMCSPIVASTGLMIPLKCVFSLCDYLTVVGHHLLCAGAPVAPAALTDSSSGQQALHA